MLKILQLPMTAMMLFTLTGCGVYHSQFECDVASGYPCQSLNQINEQINQAESGDLKPPLHLMPEHNLSDQEPALHGSDQMSQDQPLYSFPSTYKSNVSMGDSVMRIPEQTMRVWVAPYKNQSGDYMDGFTFHMVVQEGRWSH